MARDYKHAEVFSPGTRPLPLWLWFFALIAVSAFVGLIYYLDHYEKSKSMGQSVDAKTLTQQNASEKTDADAKPKFDFYKLLPKISVDVPKTETPLRQESGVHNAVTQGAQNSAAESSPQNALSFILQAGSFKEYQEADRLKANLALAGIHANIEKVTLNNTEVWHRVRIGPVQSEREMNKIRGQLRNQNIEPVILKVKG